MTRTKRTSMKPTRMSTRKHTQPQPIELKKDEEFWYDDGTIILIANNVEFRVYRGPLAKHSQVFQNMFAFPQPPTPGPSQASSSRSALDSDLSPACPTVHVADSSADLRHFLRVLVPGRTIQEPLEAPTFHAVSAWIPLGHKYEVDKLVENGLQYLRRFYPSTLNPDPTPPHIWAGPIKKDRPADVTVQGRSAIAIVNLARLTGGHDLLPVALLECCKLGADIVKGYRREDGTVESLHPDDLGRCFAAKGALELGVVGVYLRAFEYVQVDAGCRDSESCEIALGCSNYNFRTMDCESLGVDDLLVEGRMKSKITHSLCPRCRYKVVRDVVQSQRVRFWNNLPDRFKLAVDGWGVMKLL